MEASVFIATSLDGYIARADDGLDWLPEEPEEHGYEAFIASVDALVMGRRTYEVVLGFPTWPYGEKRVFVLSTRPLAPAPPGVRVERLSGEPAEVAIQLEARGVSHAYVDGGLTIQGFLRAGLIQRMVITRIPVLLGSGIPLFGPLDRELRLQHVATRTYAGGMVQSEYRIPSPA